MNSYREERKQTNKQQQQQQQKSEEFGNFSFCLQLFVALWQ